MGASVALRTKQMAMREVGNLLSNSFADSGGSPMSDIWYYVDNGVAVGPLTLQELKAKLATLSSAKDVLIWCDRFQDWRPAKDVPQFNSQSPPPLPSHEPTIGLPESKLAPANRDMGRIIIVAGVLTAVIAVAGFQYH